MDIKDFAIKKLNGYSQQCVVVDGTETTKARRYLFTENNQTLYYPSMTTILSGTKGEFNKNFLKDWRAKEIAAGRNPDEGSDRGTLIHEAAETLLLSGSFDRETLPDSVKPYWDALQPIFDEIEIVLAVETPIYHPKAKWGGRIDLLVWMNGKIVLLDFKTKSKKIVVDEENNQYYCYNKPQTDRRYCQDRVCERIVGKDDENRWHITSRKAKTKAPFIDKPGYVDDYRMQISSYMAGLLYHNHFMTEFELESELLFTSQDGKLYRMVLTLDEMKKEWKKFLKRAKVYHQQHRLVKYWETSHL